MKKKLTIAGLIAVAGCAVDHDVSDDPLERARREVGGTVRSQSQALMVRAESCDDLLTKIQQDALAKIDVLTIQYLDWYANDVSCDYIYDAAAPSAEAGADRDSSSGGGEAEAPEHSETTTQVEGVDEADIVKTDGYRIYYLTGNKLHILKSWPASETSIESTTDIEGYSHEMFVADGRAVVFSQTSDPRTAGTDCDTFYRDYGCYAPCYSSGFTKLTVLELGEEGNAPTVSREVYTEGYYQSSRRHEDDVRAVINNWGGFDAKLPQVWSYLYPSDSYYDYCNQTATEMATRVMAWRTAARAAAQTMELSDWLPAQLERVGGTLNEVSPDCDGYFVPAPGASDYGVTQITGLSLASSSSEIHQTSVYGYSSVVYANHETMVLGQYDYSAWYQAWYDDEATYSDNMRLHSFSIEPNGDVAYVASGVIPGSLRNQFSVDEQDGVIRAASTQTTWTAWWANDDSDVAVDVWVPPTTETRVYALTASNGQLNVVGQTDVMAPGESVQSARFLGDKAYVVTFRQTDPLFAVDLSDPENLEILGELHIPGFSTYIHPLDANHLLTIGFDATDTGGTTGLALQIFDISSPASPALDHKYVMPNNGGWSYSEANWNHKAFTFFPSRGLLAFPRVGWDYSNGYDFQSTLEVFDVSAEDGFTHRGSIDHTDFLDDMCPEYGSGYESYCYNYGLQINRGVFVEDYVYSLSNGGVLVHDVANLTTAVASVELSN